MRSPRRTAQTASALMVGLALVSAMAVFGASLSKSATSSVDQAISADIIVIGQRGRASSATRWRAAASAVPGVTTTTAVYSGRFEFQNSLATLTAVSTEHLADTVILRMTSGTPAALAQGELLIDSTTANVKAPGGRRDGAGQVRPDRLSATMRIGGIYKANALIGSYLVSAGFFLAHFSDPAPGRAAAAHQRQRRRGHGRHQARWPPTRT